MLNKIWFFLGAWLGCSVMQSAAAINSDCGILRLQQERSHGTSIISSFCKASDQLALDSILQLSPGSRAWIENQPTVSHSSKYQIVCENLSNSNVKIKVASQFMPWIKPDESSIKCHDWANEKLECQENDPDKSALICHISVRKQPLANHQIEQAASVVMRNGATNKIIPALAQNEKAMINAVLEKDINPKLANCAQFFDQEVTIAWTIGANGRLTQAHIPDYGRQNAFSQCVIKVMESHSFPSFSRDIHIESAFK